jgi:hypothetical protein
MLRAARSSSTNIQLTEWPGGEPSEVEVRLPAKTFKAVVRGRVSLPYGNQLSLAEAGGLAFGSRLTVRSPAGDLVALVGPARYQTSEWVLPLFQWWTLPLADHSERVNLAAESAQLRLQRGYNTRPSA